MADVGKKAINDLNTNMMFTTSTQDQWKPIKTSKRHRTIPTKRKKKEKKTGCRSTDGNAFTELGRTNLVEFWILPVWGSKIIFMIQLSKPNIISEIHLCKTRVCLTKGAANKHLWLQGTLYPLIHHSRSISFSV